MSDRPLSRRHYLLTAGALALAGCSGGSSDDDTTATDTDDPTAAPTTTPPPTTTETTTQTPTGPYGGWFSDTDNFESTVDRTGETTVTVRVGADGNGAGLAFDPPAVRVSPGATVVWEWVGGRHNVAVQSQPGDADWDGHPRQIGETGFTYEYAFETPGVYLYYCTPHLPQGMKGALVVDGEPVETGGEETLSFGDGDVVFGAAPYQPAADVAEQYSPLVEHLRTHLPENYPVPENVSVTETAPVDVQGMLDLLGQGEYELGELGPIGAAVALRRGDAEIAVQRYGYGTWEYAGLIATAPDSEIESLADLSGARVAFVVADSTSGGLYPLYSMATEGGLDIGDLPQGGGSTAEFDPVFAGSHVAAYDSLAADEVDAAAFGGFVRDEIIDDDEFAANARVIHEDAGIPRAPIVTAANLDAEERTALTDALVAAPEETFWGADGQDGTDDDLWWDRVREADRETYQSALDVVDEFDIGVEFFE